MLIIPLMASGDAVQLTVHVCTFIVVDRAGILCCGVSRRTSHPLTMHAQT